MTSPHTATARGWLYVQEQGTHGLVSFVGSSRAPLNTLPAEAHPFRFGSQRTHQFVVGDITFVPQLVIGTDMLRGRGLAGLATDDHDFERMLQRGEVILDETGAVTEIQGRQVRR